MTRVLPARCVAELYAHKVRHVAPISFQRYTACMHKHGGVHCCVPASAIHCGSTDLDGWVEDSSPT